jgi:GNAT superfamily N-acetyltransferase
MLIVRDAEPDDAAAVAGVHVRSWQAAYRGLIPDAYLDALRPEDRMARYTFGSADPDAPATIVAVEEGVIRGFATTGPSRDDDTPGAGELVGLYLDPDAWGLGVGRRLMAEARDRLVRRGFSDAILWVLVGNERAERFYRIDRWISDGQRRSEEIWGVTVDEVRYRRLLT